MNKKNTKKLKRLMREFIGQETKPPIVIYKPIRFDVLCIKSIAIDEWHFSTGVNYEVEIRSNDDTYNLIYTKEDYSTVMVMIMSGAFSEYFEIQH